MASSSACGSAGLTQFPTQLVKGVVQDLLTKELDAHFNPSDDVKKAAFEACKASRPRRLQLIITQIAASDPTGLVGGFTRLLSDVWGALSQRPELSSLHPSTLESSVLLETLSSVFQATCSVSASEKRQLMSSGHLATATLVGIALSEQPLNEARQILLLPLLEWWGDAVLTERWGIPNAWGIYTFNEDTTTITLSPLHIIATRGLGALVPFLLAKGCPADGSFLDNCYNSPAFIAFRKGHRDVFRALVAHGLDVVRSYEKDGYSLPLLLFSQGKGCKSILSDLLSRHPEIIHTSASQEASERTNLLGAALASGDADLVDLVLSGGHPVEYRCRPGPSGALIPPSISQGLFTGDRRMIEVLIAKGKALEGWKEKYDETALGSIAQALVRLAVSAFPSNRHYKGDKKNLLVQNPDAEYCVDLVLASGIVFDQCKRDDHAFLAALYPDPKGCVIEEKNALSIVKRFHRLGCRLLPWSVDKAGQRTYDLHHAAMAAGHNEVVEWCLTVLGALAEPAEARGAQSPLFVAVKRGNLAGALMLLEKYKVRAAYPELPVGDQPVMVLLNSLRLYSDADANRLLGALIERDPALFEVPCFSEAAVAEGAAKANAAGSAHVWNPLFELVNNSRPHILEFLLKASLPGVAALARRPVQLPIPGLERLSVSTVDAAATAKRWECLHVLLRYTDARVTERIKPQLPSILERAKREQGKPDGPSRALVALIEARASKELADKAEIAAASQAAGVITNAFEEPAPKPLTEKEKQKKTKKKAAKKKTKAKKKEKAANAGAGASAAHDSSDDDEDEDDEDEPDDNLVDSRNAPSLDLMLEQMGLKKRGE